MKNVKKPRLFLEISVYFSTFLRVLLNLLLVLIFIAIVIGVFKTGYDLFTSLGEPIATLLEQILLDLVFILALVEIAKTIIDYLDDGHVQVRYIVDTILIIMLNEVVALWLKGAKLEEAIGISIILATLAAIRFSLTRNLSTSKN